MVYKYITNQVLFIIRIIFLSNWQRFLYKKVSQSVHAHAPSNSKLKTCLICPSSKSHVVMTQKKHVNLQVSESLKTCTFELMLTRHNIFLQLANSLPSCSDSTVVIQFSPNPVIYPTRIILLPLNTDSLSSATVNAEHLFWVIFKADLTQHVTYRPLKVTLTPFKVVILHWGGSRGTPLNWNRWRQRNCKILMRVTFWLK